MKTLRERDIAVMEVRENHREMIINYFVERRGGRAGQPSLLEQFLEAGKRKETIGAEESPVVE